MTTTFLHRGTAVFLGAILLTASGCGSSGSEDSSGGASASSGEAKTVTVASSIGYAPYEYYAADNKTFKGLDIDLLDALEPAMNVHFDISDVRYPNIIPSLQKGSFDMAVSAFAETKENKKVINFVDYLKQLGGGVVAKDNDKIKSNQPLSLCGSRIGIVGGETTSLPYIEKTSKACKSAGKPGLAKKTFQRTADALLAIKSGQLDLRTTGGIVGRYFAKKDQELKYIDRIFPTQPETVTGIGVLASNPDGEALLKKLQAGLQKLKANGKYVKILNKYGLSEENIPSNFPLTVSSE